MATPAPEGHGTLIYQQRIADTRFVLNQLALLRRGANSDAEHPQTPRATRDVRACRLQESAAVLVAQLPYVLRRS
ncbi:hypothetical protein Aple_028370 [Acrocarpospora pleiomorpha]|uniref:Uncharacterized protein n=1 Tax=Acrocarpospora pleiomorpha TaxID=90975 RepID=A0A5M3XJV4_9ACTN|nr:hypothetical protein [Acrocarpospora pleiomorpha]GES19941.1 hypothetical protein Aple_028370 [Acrocarpospora pleiomorpha]